MTDYDDLRAKALAAQQDLVDAQELFWLAANPAVILALLDENKALRADAERYLYLRNDMPRPTDHRDAVWLRRGDDLDDAIDRARGRTT